MDFLDRSRQDNAELLERPLDGVKTAVTTTGSVTLRAFLLSA